jgi:hypothetical protein
MASTADKLVADYLKRLNGELRGLSRVRRRELVDEISEHIAEARADLESENEAAIRTLLDASGNPRRSPPRRGSASGSCRGKPAGRRSAL